jgi:hypothetical protein
MICYDPATGPCSVRDGGSRSTEKHGGQRQGKNSMAVVAEELSTGSPSYRFSGLRVGSNTRASLAGERTPITR